MSTLIGFTSERRALFLSQPSALLLQLLNSFLSDGDTSGHPALSQGTELRVTPSLSNNDCTQMPSPNPMCTEGHFVCDTLGRGSPQAFAEAA